jgi:hypothetical protein
LPSTFPGATKLFSITKSAFAVPDAPTPGRIERHFAAPLGRSSARVRTLLERVADSARDDVD